MSKTSQICQHTSLTSVSYSVHLDFIWGTNKNWSGFGRPKLARNIYRMGRVKKSSVTIPPLFRKEKISGSRSSSSSSSIISTSTSNGSNNRNSNVEPKSIIGRYRKKIGSLIVGEIERIQLSVKSSDVIAEGHEQNKREHHLKAKRSWLQSDSTLQNMECFFLSAMPNSGFSQSIRVDIQQKPIYFHIGFNIWNNCRMIVIGSLDFTDLLDSVIGNFFTEIIQIRINIEIIDGRR